MSISKKIRFEVFKRDSFCCQYCGNSAPNVLLEVDHIQPKSKDGEDNILNLITACKDCNRGKSNIELNDNISIKKQQKQLEELQERREQLQMLFDWKNELLNIDEEMICNIHEYWKTLTEKKYTISEFGIRTIRKLIKKYSCNEILDSMQVVVRQYFKVSNNTEEELKSISFAFSMIERIIKSEKLIKQKPYLKDLYYIRAIARKNFNYIVEWKFLSICEKLYLNYNVSIDQIKEMTLEARNWTVWQQKAEKFMED